MQFFCSSLLFFLNPVTAVHPPTSGLGPQCISGNGDDYRGRIAITASGNTCQHWNTQFPHKHGWIPDRYPCKYAEPPHSSKYARTWFSLSDPDKKTRGAVTLIICFLSFYHLSLLLFRPCPSFFFLHSFFFNQLNSHVLMSPILAFLLIPLQL